MATRAETAVRELYELPKADPLVVKALADRIHALTRKSGGVNKVDVSYDSELVKKAEALRRKHFRTLVIECLEKAYHYSWELANYLVWVINCWQDSASKLVPHNQKRCIWKN